MAAPVGVATRERTVPWFNCAPRGPFRVRHSSGSRFSTPEISTRRRRSGDGSLIRNATATHRPQHEHGARLRGQTNL
jgi:hypothetical protein